MTNIELPLLNHQWILNVLLGDVLDILPKTILDNIKEIVETSYSPPTRQKVWFDNPDIMIAIHLDLWVNQFQLLKSIFYS